MKCLLIFLAASLLLIRPAAAGTVMDWASSMLTGCWSCDALGEIVSIGLEFAGNAFVGLATEISTLLAILMAIWLLLLAGRTFLPFGPGGGVGRLWNQGATKLLQFAVVLAMLQSGGAFWDYVFLPVMSAGMEFSKTVVTLSDHFELTYGTSESGPAGTQNPTAAYCASPASDANGVSGAIAVMRQMNCPLATIQSQFAKGMLIGVAQLIGAPRQDGFGAETMALISGLVINLVYFFGMLMFPLFLIDVLMRLTIVTTIAPLALAASLFGPTRKIFEKLIWQIVHAALTLVFLSIVGGIGKATLAYIFANLSLDGIPAGARNWNDLISMLEQQKNASGALFKIDMTCMSFYQLVGTGVILIYMLRQASRMAGEFSGSGGSDFSGAMAGVASMAGAVGYATGRMVRSATPTGQGGGSLPARVSGSGGSQDE